jgi:hypothetical protein
MFSIAISIMLNASDATRNQYLDYAKKLLDRDLWIIALLCTALP